MSYVEIIAEAAAGDVDEARVESEVRRAVDAYERGYRRPDDDELTTTLDEWDRLLTEGRISAGDGKRIAKRMRDRAAKLREDVGKVLSHNAADLLHHAAGAYEPMPDVRRELDERNAHRHPDGLDAVGGFDVVVEDLAELARVLDRIGPRLEAVTSARVRRSRKTNLRQLALDLADVFRRHTGREPSSGGQGTDRRGGSPFARFVDAVLAEHVPDEAGRQALGQSLYQWLREDRELREVLAAVEAIDGRQG